MGKSISIVSIVCLLGALLMLISGIVLLEDTVKLEQEYYRLQHLINSSSDGALTIALEKNNVGEGVIDINKDLVSEVFYSTMLKGNNLPISDSNLIYMYSKIPLVALALDDGIYLGYAQNKIHDKTGKKTFEFVWEEKMPYTVYYKDKAYALDMSKDEASSVMTKKPFTLTLEDEIPKEILNKKTELINAKITQIVTQTINKLSDDGVSIFIPPQLTTKGMVNITGPCLMSITQDFDLNTKPIDLFTLATTEFAKPKIVVGFIEDGKRLYCFDDELSGDKVQIVQTFPSFESAAKNGYEPDLGRIK